MAETAAVTEKMAVTGTSRVSGATGALSELVRSMASVETTVPVTDRMESTAREQRVMARAAVVAAAAAVETDQDGRVVRSSSVASVEVTVHVTDEMEAKNSAAAAAATATADVVEVFETFHTSAPTIGEFTVGRRVVGTMGVQTTGGGTTGRACKGTVT